MPNPIFLAWGPITIKWYGVMVVIGMILGVILACAEAKRQEQNADHYFNMCLMVLVVGVLGARAYYVLFNWGYYGANLMKILAFREGGLAIHGGLIAGGLTFVLSGAHYRIGGLTALDIAAPSAALGQAIGRWGNFFNQEAYGYAVSRDVIPWAMFIDGAYRHPTFLYESIWDLLVFLFLLWHRRRRNLVNGDVFFMYTILYSAGRVVIESFRTDSLMLGSWRMAQVISVVAMVLAILAMWISHRGKNQGGKIINVR
ncbi:MAG: prolipoprotein diacylglyceryl transferase [Peptococcaceae bacterium]|jgi:phosphatidylglycerol:prolipoprotein diacylglycerol transferase|nr:prolipoprotein diacylglyceryl transferase [Peptococcaceae bacterium]